MFTKYRFGAIAAIGSLAVTTPIYAAPANTVETITSVSQSQIASYKPYSYYASAGYCEPSMILPWACGTNCQANANFTPIAVGGDGTMVQFWFVGYDSTIKRIVVSHQGTDPDAVIPLIIDADFELARPDPTLFPGLNSSIEVHRGFLTAHLLSAPDVLNAVTKGIQTYNTTEVVLTGHSLGAAISLIHTAYLSAHIPSVRITYVGYGLPRVGNPEFAAYVDGHNAVVSMTHINNKQDPVPIIPGRGMGYSHPAGEIHIDETGVWNACPGHDNVDNRCAVGAVSNIFVGDLHEHDGPYDGVMMGCDS